ncbi:MAG: plastocyanin/azurin family copper-binding protein [Actinomycetota bacterium]
MRTRRARVVATAAASALGLGVFAASGVGATNLKLSTVGACCKFNVKTLTAKAGTVTITLTNKSGTTPHNVAIKGKKKGLVVTGGKTSKVTATLKKGTYVFYCSVAGHEAAGMKGTLKVT